MLAIPSQVLKQFEAVLKNKKVPDKLQWAYKKWLRYYLDFCGKYNYQSVHKDNLPQFIRKLQEKKQTKEQQDQAIIAVNLYYEIVKIKNSANKKIASQSENSQKNFTSKNVKAFSIRESAAITSQNKNTSQPVNP